MLDPSSPQKINSRYEIKDPAIGEGGMGVVYKAYDTVTKRYVALKTMRGNVDPAAIELFEREWTVLARMSHPNIVDILDTGEFRDDGQRKPYFVMPLLPGVTLDHLIKSSSQRLTVERTVEIMCQACRGLQAAHDHGLVHRDLKPSNIFVMDDDTVKIIDFGVVHLADQRSVTGMKGTIQYMAPEQLEMKPATPMSDIFSLAVVCYEALTKRKPFTGKTEGELVDAIRTLIPPPVSDLNGAVNQLVSRTVHKAMAKQPWHRFSSAKEFADTLQKALRNEPIERFDRNKILPKIERIKRAHGEGDYQFALEMLTELESEGHMDPEMSLLRIQIDQSIRQKTIRHLLESARTRMEEDELPLAMQKIQEVLSIDPGNVDACSLKSQIERQRSEKQIENWFRLVREHLDNQLYSQARQGIQEILKINASDSRARELLAEIDRTEREAVKIREEKQKLYEAAVASYKNGEISTALSKLEHLLDLNRAGPKSITPDKDAQYQSLYNQVRSERDAARNAYAEGRKYLADHNFVRALEICQEFLQKHPGDPMFQALKIEAEETQRQEQSSAIAEVNRRVEAEPDLDKKYNIIKEAVERYPNEQHFKSSLKLVKDRRDLINSIVGRARQYEERGQFNDAAGQWDILRNIYPLYPGLDFEVQRLTRRRDEQVKDEFKAKWVERIDHHFGAGEYSKARGVIKEALLEFPDDKELQGLESLAEQGIKRSSDADSLLTEGKTLFAQRKYEEGLQTLRKAERLDERNPLIRAELLSAVLQHARDLMSRDWHAAEPLVKEALELDSSDPVARSLSSLVQDYKRQEAIGRFVLEARDLQASGDLSGALRKVEEGLRVHPNEIRLSQLHNTLRNALGENRRSEALPSSPVETPRTPPKPEPPDLPPPVKTTFQPIPPVVPAGPTGASASESISKTEQGAGSGAVPPVKPPASPVLVPAKQSPEPSTTQGTGKTDWKKRGPLLLGAALVAIILVAAALFFKRTTGGPAPSNTQPPVKTKTAPPPPPPPPHPSSPELLITADLKSGSGKFVLDGSQPVDLQQGSMTKDIPPGTHTLVILDGNKEVFSFGFHAEPNEVPSVISPPSGTSAGVVVTSFGPTAKVYASAKVKGGVEGQPLQPIPAEGDALTLPAQGGLRFVVEDSATKSHTIVIDSSAVPALSVTLSGATERIPFVIKANVDTAFVVVDGYVTKAKLVNGAHAMTLPAGKTYRITLKRDDYESPPEQMLQLKSGDTTPQTLTFALTPIAHDARLTIDSAPVDTEVLVDDNRIGSVGSSGSFSNPISPGKHIITLRKTNYESYSDPKVFKAGETVKISGDVLKPYGSMALKVMPANARITYHRGNETQEVDRPNNATYPLPSGDYVVTAEAQGYTSTSSTVTISPGKTVTVDWNLKPIPQVGPTPLTATNVFENGASWKIGPSGWWIHDAKGPTFFRAREGTFVVDIVKDTHQGLFKKHVNAIAFFVDYTGAGNYVGYTLDGHNLTRKVYSGGHAEDEKKVNHGMESGQTFRITLEITPEAVVIKNNTGKVLDSFKRNGAGGKFGFEDEVELSVH